MNVIVLTALLTAAPPTGFTAAMERMPLVRTQGKVTVRVEAVRGLVFITGMRMRADAKGELCPRWELRRDTLVLKCATRQLWAEVDVPGAMLELRRLRGLPITWGDEAIPFRAWTLSSLGIPEKCPGRMPSARGECFLAEGNWIEARKAYLEGLGTPDASLSRIRLGDFAMENGDFEAALGWYAQIQAGGPVGRMAAERECELSGSCFGTEKAQLSSMVGLQEPMKTEAELRLMRREVIRGNVAGAVGMMAERLTRQPPVCETALGFCQALTLAGLESEDESAQINALSMFTDPQLRDGPYDEALMLAAAQTAELVGAPAFAAAALSSFTSRVPRAELPAHLLRVAQLYLAGNDRVRAAVIAEYAESKLGLGALSGPAWLRVRQQVARVRPTAPVARPRQGAPVAPTLPQLESDVSLAAELARAAALRSRALDEPRPLAPPAPEPKP